ncbi:hypothetical protein A0257_19965 [Hymenobacter psoromatis]|nr:hypothetical protein A0257_19965 [Hymenobacter psoromatis]
MFTKEQLLQIMPEVPAEFSIEELEAILKQPQPAAPPAYVLPPRPANLTPQEAAEWDYYTSPEAQALYNKFPVSPAVAALRGSLKLKPEDEHKSYDELRWEAMRTKYHL